jgi:hypothetical protein
MVPLTLALAVFMGVIVGLLGGGGSILTVPLLIYLVGLEPKVAIASSLLVVGLTSAGGALHHAWRGTVRWRTGLIFGTCSMAGAYGAGMVARFIPGQVLLLVFAILMAGTAIGLMRHQPGLDSHGRPLAPRPFSLPIVASEGLAVGGLSGLVGAGGGFLVVPVLVMRVGLDMRSAVGTSLLIIVLNAFSAFAGYLTHVQIDWALALSISAASVAGALGGASLSGIVSQHRLRHAFAWLVLAMAAFIASQEIIPGWSIHPSHTEGGQPLGLGANASATALVRAPGGHFVAAPVVRG